MQKNSFLKTLLICCSLLVGFAANATMVKQMNLGELTSNADKIFRGKVLKTETGTIRLGGADLPTVKYILEINDVIKGEFPAIQGKPSKIVEITMLGRFKPNKTKSGLIHASAFKPPVLNNGKEYLLFTTRPSSAGLSMTVGLEQGTFRFVGGEKVINDAKNAGLFRNMSSNGLPSKGPIPYNEMVTKVRSLVTTQGGE